MGRGKDKYLKGSKRTGKCGAGFVGRDSLMNNEPVRSYYSKDRHYWEDEEGKGKSLASSYGFAGEGYIERNGVRRNLRQYLPFFTNLCIQYPEKRRS